LPHTAWHWYSYGMYHLKPGDYVLSFKSAHLRERMAIHCFAVLPLITPPDGRAAIVPPFKPLEARGSGWSPQAQLLVSNTPGAQAKVHFEMPVTAIYDVYLIALIPAGYRLRVALENLGEVREVEVVGGDGLWRAYPLGSFPWGRGQGSFTFTNDPDNGDEAVKVDALLLVPRTHRVYLPLVRK